MHICIALDSFNVNSYAYYNHVIYASRKIISIWIEQWFYDTIYFMIFHKILMRIGFGFYEDKTFFDIYYKPQFFKL